MRVQDPREVEKGGEKYMLNHQAKKGFSQYTDFPMTEDLAERQQRQRESKTLLDTGSQPSFWRHYCWFPVVLVACVLMFGLYYAYMRVAEKELGDDDDGTR